MESNERPQTVICDDRIRHMRFKAEMERRVAEKTRRFSNLYERDRRIRQEGYEDGYDAGWEEARKYYSYNI